VGQVTLAIRSEDELKAAESLLHDAWFDPCTDIQYDPASSTFTLMLWREMEAEKGDPEEEEGRYMRCRLRIGDVRAADIAVDKYPVVSTFTAFRYQQEKELLSLEILGTASVSLRVSSICAEVVDTGDVADHPRW